MRNQKVKRLLRRAAAISLAMAVTMTAVPAGSLISLAEDGAPTEGTSTEDGTTTEETLAQTQSPAAEDVNGQLDTAADAAQDVVDHLNDAGNVNIGESIVISVPFGDILDVGQKEQEAIGSETGAGDLVEGAEKDIEDAEAEINEDNLLNNKAEDGTETTGSTEQNTADANTNIDSAETTMGDAQGAFDAALEDAKSKIEAGFTTSEEAQGVLNDLTKAQEDAQAEFDKAQSSMDDAKANLDQAQADYDAAKAISDEAAAEAKAKLEAAQEEMAKAVLAADTANKRVQKVKDALSKVSDEYLEQWKDDVDGALKDVEEKLEESQKELDKAIENLDTENEELKAAADDFKEKFDDFTDATKDFTASVKDAADKQKELERLYGQYKDLQDAYDAAKQEYENAGGDERKAELESQLAALEEAMRTAEGALEDAREAKDAFDIANETEYVKNLQEQKDILADGESTEEAKKAAEKALAELVIENELAGKEEGRTVVWVSKDDENSQYGKPGEGIDGFYVVLDENGNVVKRYGYTVNTDGENKGTVNILEMTGQDTTNYIEIEGKEDPYPITVGDDGSMTIEVDGETIDVYKDGDEYYIRKSADGDSAIQMVDDISRPSKVGTFTVRYDEDTKKNYITIRKNVGSFLPKWEEVEVELIHRNNSWYYIDPDNNRENQLFVFTVDYNDKPVINWNGTQCDVKTDDNGNDYITTEDGKTVYIFGEKDGNGNYTGTYTYRESVEYKEGGDANTIYGYGAAGSDSEKYMNVYNDWLKKGEELTAAQDTYTDFYNNEYLPHIQKWEEVQETYKALYGDEKTGEYGGDLGSLAELPRSVGDLFGNVSLDKVADIRNTLVKINEIKDAIESGDIAGALENLGNLDLSSISSILPDGVDLKEFIVNIAIGDSANETITDSKILSALVNAIGIDMDKWSPAKHEYAVAWMDALKAKIEVVKKGEELVKATNATLVSGMELIKAGADVNDALLDVMITGVQTGILAGAAGSLEFAGDVLDAANRLVEDLEGKVGELQLKTQEAYDEALKAQNMLAGLKLKNPKEEELAAAEEALEAAWARYRELNGKLENAEASLEEAEGYKKAAEDEYNRLNEIENRPTGDENGSTGGGNNPGRSSGTTGGTGNADIIAIEEEPVPQAFENAGEFAENVVPVLRRTVRTPAGVAETGEGEQVVLEDEETPLAGADAVEEKAEEDFQEIEEEEVPLANVTTVCYLEWIILLMTIAFAVYNGVRTYGRHKAAEE